MLYKLVGGFPKRTRISFNLPDHIVIIQYILKRTWVDDFPSNWRPDPRLTESVIQSINHGATASAHLNQVVLTGLLSFFDIQKSKDIGWGFPFAPKAHTAPLTFDGVSKASITRLAASRFQKKVTFFRNPIILDSDPIQGPCRALNKTSL